MSSKIVECVPNFSEGRDRAKIKAITDAIEATAGVKLLDVDPGADMNRTVVTFVGSPEAVAEAAFQAIAKAAQVIDMRGHRGTHPRMGATDVCPFVPVAGMTLEDCAAIARQVGRRVGDELGIGVYCYEAAARDPRRRNLADVRRGEYEGLAAKLRDPAWKPDYGPAEFNAQSGATIIGAREFLIAYNITLNTRDAAAATDIAFELREKGRVARAPTPSPYYHKGEILVYAENHFPCGNCDFVGRKLDEIERHCRESHGYELRKLAAEAIPGYPNVVGQKVRRAGEFKCCKAIGWYANAYGRAQISINLTNFHVTPPHAVLERARQLAADRGLVITGSEVVGLIPFEALIEAGRFYLARQGRSPHVPVADVLETAVHSMGLADVAPFEIEKKVIGLPEWPADSLVAMPVAELVDEVSRDTPAPGGGSIAALAASLGAALASMVAAITHHKTNDPKKAERALAIAERAQEVKDRLLLAVDADTAAFNAYLEAMRLPKTTAEEQQVRKQKMQEGLKQAIAVPFETALAAVEAMRVAREMTRDGHAASMTDAAVGCAMAFAGVRGGLWNVLINLKGIDDPPYVAEMRKKCEAVLKESRAILRENDEQVDAAL